MSNIDMDGTRQGAVSLERASVAVQMPAALVTAVGTAVAKPFFSGAVVRRLGTQNRHGRERPETDVTPSPVYRRQGIRDSALIPGRIMLRMATSEPLTEVPAGGFARPEQKDRTESGPAQSRAQRSIPVGTP